MALRPYYGTPVLSGVTLSSPSVSPSLILETARGRFDTYVALPPRRYEAIHHMGRRARTAWHTMFSGTPDQALSHLKRLHSDAEQRAQEAVFRSPDIESLQKRLDRIIEGVQYQFIDSFFPRMVAVIGHISFAHPMWLEILARYEDLLMLLVLYRDALAPGYNVLNDYVYDYTSASYVESFVADAWEEVMDRPPEDPWIGPHRRPYKQYSFLDFIASRIIMGREEVPFRGLDYRYGDYDVLMAASPSSSIAKDHLLGASLAYTEMRDVYRDRDTIHQDALSEPYGMMRLHLESLVEVVRLVQEHLQRRGIIIRRTPLTSLSRTGPRLTGRLPTGRVF